MKFFCCFFRGQHVEMTEFKVHFFWKFWTFSFVFVTSCRFTVLYSVAFIGQAISIGVALSYAFDSSLICNLKHFRFVLKYLQHCENMTKYSNNSENGKQYMLQILHRGFFLHLHLSRSPACCYLCLLQIWLECCVKKHCLVLKCIHYQRVNKQN